MDTETEIYRFGWDSSFDGDTLIRVGRRNDRVLLRATRRPSLFGGKVEPELTLSMEDSGSAAIRAD